MSDNATDTYATRLLAQALTLTSPVASNTRLGPVYLVRGSRRCPSDWRCCWWGLRARSYRGVPRPPQRVFIQPPTRCSWHSEVGGRKYRDLPHHRIESILDLGYSFREKPLETVRKVPVSPKPRPFEPIEWGEEAPFCHRRPTNSRLRPHFSYFSDSSNKGFSETCIHLPEYCCSHEPDFLLGLHFTTRFAAAAAGGRVGALSVAKTLAVPT